MLGHRRERPGEVGEPHHLAGIWRPAVGEERRGGRRVAGQKRLLVAPQAGADLADREAALGELARGLEEVGQRQATELRGGVRPQPYRARDGDRLRAARGHVLAAAHRFEGRVRPGAPGALETAHTARRRLEIQEEGVAAEAGHHRREDRHRGPHRHARVGGRAAGVERTDPRQRGPRVLAGDRAGGSVDGRAPAAVGPLAHTASAISRTARTANSTTEPASTKLASGPLRSAFGTRAELFSHSSVPARNGRNSAPRAA